MDEIQRSRHAVDATAPLHELERSVGGSNSLSQCAKTRQRAGRGWRRDRRPVEVSRPWETA